MGRTQLLFPLSVAPHAPLLRGNPVNASHIGRRDQAFALQKLGIPLRPGRIHCHAFGQTFTEIDQRKHLAADRLVANPVHKIVAPLHRLHGMRQRQQKLTCAFDIHAQSIERFLQGIEQILYT